MARNGHCRFFLSEVVRHTKHKTKKFCASTNFFCVRPTFCDHWICKMNPPCGKRTETNTKRTFWRLLVFQPTVSIFGRAPPSAWLLSFAVPVFSSLLGARLKCATSRSRTVPNFYTIFSESIEPLNLCAISGNKTMDLFSRKYWLVNQNLPEYWIYSLKLPKNNSVSQSPFFSGYVSFTECIVIIIYLGFLSCSWHSPSAMVITLSLSWSPFPSKSERLPPFPDSCLRQTNKTLKIATWRMKYRDPFLIRFGCQKDQEVWCCKILIRMWRYQILRLHVAIVVWTM